VEFKRPGVHLGRKEIAQIEDYALAVTSTPFADSDRTQWVFVLISDELDDYVTARTHQTGMPTYTVMKEAGKRYEIRAYPWKALIRSANARHEHLRAWLSHNVTLERAMERATAAYAEYLPPPKKVGNDSQHTGQQTDRKKRRKSA
jgi:hypothetical protein